MKKAIVVGATSGIGRELAVLLVKNGYFVGVTGRREELLSELVAEFPSAMSAKSFDLIEVEIVPEKLDELVGELGGLDLLILSSGTGELNPELDFVVEQQTICVNVLGFTCVTDWAFRYFEQQGAGHLAAISSIAGIRGGGIAPAYNATKAYQINYLEGLRQKARKSGKAITITDIRPGFVDTAMAKGDGQFWVAPVGKAAQQMLSAIQRKKNVVYVTKRWRLLAGLLKRIPRRMYAKMG